MTPLIPLPEAQKRLLDLVRKTATESVSADAALGRYLTKPLIAARTQPSADLSAMDGYAVSGDGPWRIIGESRCGVPFSGALASGQATQISTGAHMPAGSHSIVLVEDAQVSSDNFLTTGENSICGRHIRRAGSDFREGHQLLDSGTRIGATQLALVRMGGHNSLEAHSAPKLAILESGDELAFDPAQCEPYQIPASNGAMLRAMAEQEHVQIAASPPIADRLDAVIAAIDSHRDCNMVVISGGASVGDHDLVRPALEQLGAKLDFWRVAIKPGKPLLVATRGNQIILGLPGNPASSFVTAFLFMLPALRKMLGAEVCLPQRIMFPCSVDLDAGGPRRTFTRAALNSGQITPVSNQGSGAVGALASANVLIERPEHCDGTKAGTYVPCYLFGNGGIA